MSHAPVPSPDTADPRRPGGRVEALWVKRAKRGPMDPAESVAMDAGEGIRGNANRGGWRQVTVIEAEVFEELADELDPSVSAAMRRANVMVRGIRLANCRGRILHLGDCRIEMRGETVPCERMDEALPGLRSALGDGWGGGAFGRVLNDGEVRVGDAVRWGDAR